MLALGYFALKNCTSDSIYDFFRSIPSVVKSLNINVALASEASPRVTLYGWMYPSLSPVVSGASCVG